MKFASSENKHAMYIANCILFLCINIYNFISLAYSDRAMQNVHP